MLSLEIRLRNLKYKLCDFIYKLSHVFPSPLTLCTHIPSGPEMLSINPQEWAPTIVMEVLKKKSHSGLSIKHSTVCAVVCFCCWQLCCCERKERRCSSPRYASSTIYRMEAYRWRQHCQRFILLSLPWLLLFLQGSMTQHEACVFIGSFILICHRTVHFHWSITGWTASLVSRCSYSGNANAILGCEAILEWIPLWDCSALVLT